MTLLEIKSLLVAAHREQNWEQAKELSRMKEALKKKVRHYCEICGNPIRGSRCSMHITRLKSAHLFRRRIVALMFLILPSISFALGFGWTASPDPSVIGYFLEYGPASGNYTSKIDVGNVTHWNLDNAPDNPTFYSVVAYDAFGNEAVPSNELVRPPLPQVIQSITIQNAVFR